MTTASTYEDYSRVAMHYDQTRQPIGVPILVGCFATAGRPLGDLHLLDAGCGTASYAIELLKWVAQVDGVDACAEMIRQGQEKAAARAVSADHLRFHRAAITQLPFGDESFDGVMVNQVLHHLGDELGSGFHRHKAVFAELGRVTRAGGVLVINTCSHEQLNDACWYQPFFPQAFDRFRQRLIPFTEMIELLEQCGFTHQATCVPADALIRGSAYFEFDGPLSPEWRDGDSVFSLATKKELAHGCDQVREMLNERTLREWVLQRDTRRSSIGQISFLSFRKVEPPA